MFYKKAVLKNFAKLTVNHLCWSHFLIRCKSSCLLEKRLKFLNFIKKRLHHRHFSMNFGKLLTKHFGTNAATLKNNALNLFLVTPLAFHFFIIANLWINHLAVPIMTTKCSKLVNNSDYWGSKELLRSSLARH